MFEPPNDEIAEELVYSSEGVEVDGYVLVERYFVEEHRWTNEYAMIVRHCDANHIFWRRTYEMPTTEEGEGMDIFESSFDWVRVRPNVIQCVEWVEFNSNKGDTNNA